MCNIYKEVRNRMNDIEIIKTAHGMCVRIKDFHAILIPFSFWEKIKETLIREFLEKHPLLLHYLYEIDQKGKGCATIDELLEELK